MKGYLAARSPRSLKSINIYQLQFTAAAVLLVSIDELINCHGVSRAVKGQLLCDVSPSAPSEEDIYTQSAQMSPRQSSLPRKREEKRYIGS